MFFRKKQQVSPTPRFEPYAGRAKAIWPNFRKFARAATQNKDGTERFAAYRAPAAVVPNDARMAYDNALNQACAAVMPFIGAYGGANQSWLTDGLGFLGYPYLAEMAQRAEFRKPCDVIAREATREWIKLRHDADEVSDDARLAAEIDQTNESEEKVKQIEDEIDRLNIRRLAHELIMHALLYGIGHVYIDVAAQHGDTDPSLPLKITPQGIKQGSLRGFKLLEPVWCAPNVTNSFDPFRDDFYRPQQWFVMGRTVHQDRLIDVVPYPVSDILKPAFNFGGLSLTQQLRPYVHNFLRTRNSISNITSNFSKLVLLTDMAGNMQSPASSNESFPGMEFGDVDGGSLVGRANLMQSVSESQSTIVADKNAEDVKVVATPLGGLNDLQASAMEAMASIPGIPLVKLFGIQPTGLNASSEGEIRVFYDEIASFQEAHLRPVLRRILDVVQLNLWGDIDPNLAFEFAPLWQLDEERLAAVEKLKTDIDLVNIQAGKISPEEARSREQQDDGSIYSKISLSGEAPSQSYMDSDTNGFRPQDFAGSSIANGGQVSSSSPHRSQPV